MAQFIPYVPKPGSVPARVIAYLESLPKGAKVTTPELAAACGFPRNNAATSLTATVSSGAIVRTEGSKTILWSLGDPAKAVSSRKIGRKTAAKVETKPAKAKAMTVVPKQWQTRLRPDLPVVIPAGLKVTRCPSAVDMRFKAEPGFVGEFDKEWRRLRA